MKFGSPANSSSAAHGRAFAWEPAAELAGPECPLEVATLPDGGSKEVPEAARRITGVVDKSKPQSTAVAALELLLWFAPCASARYPDYLYDKRTRRTPASR